MSASYSPRHAGGLWLISGDVDASRAGEAATAVLDVLAELRKSSDSYRADFVLARQKVLEELVVASTSSSAMADRLAQMARFDLPDYFYERVAHDVANLTLADFDAFLKSELRPEHRVFGAFGNKPAVDAAIAVARGRD
jgi:predicted Zn-dependent peptidase